MFDRTLFARVNYAKRNLRIMDPAAYTPSPAATVVPISVEGLPVANAVIQRPGEAPIPCRFVIDTGVRTALVLYRPFRDAAPVPGVNSAGRRTHDHGHGRRRSRRRKPRATWAACAAKRNSRWS